LTDIPALPASFLASLAKFLAAEDILTAPEDCCVYSYGNSRHVLPQAVVFPATHEQVVWQTRKALSPALRKVAPKKINEDVVVPDVGANSIAQGA
jgi:FAD/FMN-containing dehydrogenase